MQLYWHYELKTKDCNCFEFFLKETVILFIFYNEDVLLMYMYFISASLLKVKSVSLYCMSNLIIFLFSISLQ